MAETSYIIQNGRRLNLKDTTARKSIGSCDELETEVKHCLVHAINELNQKVCEGGIGEKGDPGAIFTPSVDSEGNLSWSNNGGLENPETVNIKGQKGEPGYTPVKGVDYFDGQPGKDGVSCTHSWNGTTLTVTSASGTSSANLKGEKGDKGDPGSDATVTVDSALSSSSTNPVQNKVVNAGIANSYDKVISRGEQLVVNGNGMMGNNTNFSNFDFDGAVANNSPGSFTKPPSVYYNPIENDEYFPVNTANTYKFSLDCKSKNGLATMYSFLSFYDVDKKRISVTNHHFVVGSTTTLAQDLKKGDKVVYLTDASGWTTTVNAAVYFYIWNYTNSYGYTYPPETYTRNVYNIQNSGGYPTAIDKENNTVELTSAYTGATVPAGTAVTQGRAGSIYKYRAMSGAVPPTTWQTYSGTIGGVDTSGNNVLTKFPPGTAYTKVGFLWNTKAVDDRVWVTNISVTDISGANTTYKLSKSGSTITLTASDGSTTSVTDSNTTYSAATASAAGLMSAGDKTKLDGIDNGANAYTHPTSHPASMITGLSTVATSGNYNDLSNKPTIPAAVTVDSALSSTSTNPVQNKVINSALDEKVNLSETQTITGAKTFENTGTVAQNVAIALKSANMNKGTNPMSNCFNSIDFTDKNNANIAKFSAIQTNDGWTGFLAGAGSDPTNPQNNLLMIASGSSKLMLIPPTSGHGSCAVRRDYLNSVVSGIQTQIDGKAASSNVYSKDETVALINEAIGAAIGGSY